MTSPNATSGAVAAATSLAPAPLALSELVLKDEGSMRTIVEMRVRKSCESCGEPAVHLYWYLYENFRRNPQSNAYGKDDCIWCKDIEVALCAECKPITPGGCGSGYTQFTVSEGMAHLFLEWRTESKDITLGYELQVREAMHKFRSTIQQLKAVADAGH